MRQRFVEQGRARLAVRVWGDDSGRPIMALHPGVGDSRIWQWCAPAWAEAGHLVVAPDRRGFGDTHYEAEPHDDLDDLLAVTAASGARPAVLIGNSRGGGLALDCTLAHPDLVTALVLISPSVSGYDASDWPTTPGEAALDDLIEAAEAAGDLRAVNELETRLWLDGPDQPDGRVTGPARDLMRAMNARALAAAPPGPAAERDPVWPRLAEIGCPTLVVAGEHDLAGMVRRSQHLADALPGGRFGLIPGSAHCPALDQPDTLSRLVSDFLGQVAA